MRDIHIFALLALTITGCAGVQPDPQAEARAVFDGIERRLLDESPKRFNFTVETDGALVVKLTGRVRRGASGEIALDAGGLFDERRVDLMLRANDETMTGGEGARIFALPTPPAVEEAVFLGFTRMGILHNLAMLASGRPPDHSAGGLREWLTVAELALANDPDPDVHVLTFDVVVDGQRRAAATLWVDRATMRPLRRDQRVDFPSGSMRVVERYTYPE